MGWVTAEVFRCRMCGTPVVGLLGMAQKCRKCGHTWKAGQ